MNHVITYVTNTEDFLVELETIAPTYINRDEDGNVTTAIQTTPIVKSENGTLALSILTDDEIAFIGTMTTIESLGTYEEMFANPEALAKYKSVYPYDVPIAYIDEDGVERSYMRPEKIGVFAS